MAKVKVTRLKRLPIECQKIFTGLIAIIYREPKTLNLLRVNIPMKKWKLTQELNRDFSKEEVEISMTR
jgi:hypothetical protein